MNISLLLTALLAGLALGSHCIGMCGGIATTLSRVRQPGSKVIPIQAVRSEQAPDWSTIAALHVGRLLTYAMAGGVVGAFGAAGLLLKPIFPVHTILFFVGNLSLIYLGLRCLGIHPLGVLRLNLGIVSSGTSKIAGLVASIGIPQSALVRGMLWGCLPCGLLYGVLPLALLSGTYWGGACLMFAFGVGTLPYLLLTEGLIARFGRQKPPDWLAIGSASILIGMGCVGLFMLNMHHDMGWWC